MDNVRIGKTTGLRKFAALLLTLSCVLSVTLTSFADMVSDAPMVSSETVSSGTSSGGPVISDAPLVSNDTREINEISVVETTSAQPAMAPLETKAAESTGTKPEEVSETLPALSTETTTKAPKVEETLPALTDGTKETKSKDTKVEETLPVLTIESGTKAVSETAAVAELPSITQAETTSESVVSIVSIVSTPVIETKTTMNVSAPQSRNVSSDEAGSAHANDSVTRIYLDFSLISPSHKYGSTNVARASVKLSDGTWQKFEYKEHIRYPFYKMTSQGTDSDGDSCYVAAAHARRFGDSTTDDGEMKTELYLKASDCTVRNYLDISTTNQKRIAIVKAALSMLGKQYTYGGNGPDAYDCSGLVKNVMAQAGISVPRTSTQLLSMDGQISASELRPGDIMARAGHCGIYIGNGIFVHASDSSVGVIAEYLSVYNQVNKFTNCINVVGD